MSTPFVINIGRQLGSGGREIGKRLAERFNIAYYDKEILSLAAQESGLRQGLFERSDEKKGLFRSIFHVVQPFFGGGGDFYENQLSEENLFIIQSRVMQRLASERSSVFIGRVADYILREHPRHVNIFITANLDDRIRRVAQRRNVLPKAAQSIIEEADEERAKAMIADIASAYEQPAEVVEYYSKNEELMNNIRNVVLEEQAVDAVLAKAQVTEKVSSFDEIMNPQA